MAVKVGDLYQDLDRRNVSPRVVRVTYLADPYALVSNVEHWDEKQIGRRTQIRPDRLESRKFKKVSR